MAYRERERTLSAPDDWTVPALDVDGATVERAETVRLDALYYDTPDLRLLARDPGEAVAEPGTETAGLPVLTAPLTVVTPDPRHWVLIGSLVEDLRRIHVEIAGHDAAAA